MSVLCGILLAISLSVHSAASQLQNCDYVNEIFPDVFALQSGSALSKCSFNGQQCCDDILIKFVDQGFRFLVQNDAFNFTSGLAGAQAAIDQMRNKTNEIVDDVINDVLRPLLLSSVQSPPSSFRGVVESVINDINIVLNGKHVDLKASIAKYFRAVALYYFDELLDSFPLITAFIRLSDSQKRCGSQVLFNHIYSRTESAAKLVDLIQNISVAVGVIKQLPPIFDNLLQNFLRFRFSDSCLDVFASNYLCPVCRNQPFMCPGRCAEIVTGCISPLHQSIVQLDTSTRLILSIIKSLIGASDSVTDAVTISRISVFYDDLVQSLKTLDFLDLGFILRVFRECRISFGFPFGKRSLSEMNYKSVTKHKRALEIPNVGIDETFLKTLEKQFSSLGGDKLANATKTFCSPDFSVEFAGLEFPVTKANGMCSYGVCNVGHYNNTYKKQDIADQCFNPAGQFNYSQLIDQAKNQTYVLTELFSTTDIPKSVFSVFLPDETLPTTKFLEAPPPAKPTVNPSTACMEPTSSTTTTATTPTQTTSPCNSCPLSISGKYISRRKRTVVRFSSSNPDASFKCELNDQKATPCKTPKRWKITDQGNHTATIHSICIMNDVVTTCSKNFKFQVRN